MIVLTFLSSLFGRKKPNKSAFTFAVRTDDVFIVSYPKSGNTWVRFLIGNYVSGNSVNFMNAHLIIPDMHFNPAQIDKVEAKPRFIKSHFAYQPEFTKTIYIVRDGREVAVSLYYYMRKMKEIPADVTLSQFMDQYFFTGKTTFGYWDQHVLSWVEHEQEGTVLLVKYEDMIAAPVAEAKRMIEFSGLPIDNAKIESAVANSSFESMKRDEQKDPDLIAKLGKASLDTGYGFVRKGETESWRTELNESEKLRFITQYGKALERFGYPLK